MREVQKHKLSVLFLSLFVPACLGHETPSAQPGASSSRDYNLTHDSTNGAPEKPGNNHYQYVGDPNRAPAETSLPPVIEKYIEGVGMETVTVQANVHSRLKVQFQPEPDFPEVGDTGHQAYYSQMIISIQVGDQKERTQVLGTGHDWPQEVSRTMDFSHAIPDGCDEEDPDCRTTVDIEIFNPNTDHWCNYAEGYHPDTFEPVINFCFENGGYTEPHENHPWTGTVFIETDDTEPLELGVQNDQIGTY